MASQQQASYTPNEIRDLWQTPEYLFWWANSIFNFDIDLAAADNNRKLDSYFTKEEDSLKKAWHRHGQQGWCNPPYSESGIWLGKAGDEVLHGFKSAFLVPTPNGESQYRDHVFGKANEIIFINGRIAFIAAEDFVIPGKKGKPDRQVQKGEEIDGNTRGSCIVVYDRPPTGITKTSWVDRDDMKKQYLNFKDGLAQAA